ncbi:hypothetical protein [Aureibacter tunicatorum]|uniref:Uncharacterized protein n=1 Tax=Aureibacter tunicatorum TaxID=866807 RepID=A0AAE3XP05_9BACT|nr:hypothetical protein [Aureibacter tunicatorum]MDR6239400.1 hypothetical protein [Aureibacter tunicatorum]BDD04677.1 hypothetical protein AUTU_21600 [Aureibacter tunicatorum]
MNEVLKTTYLRISFDIDSKALLVVWEDTAFVTEDHLKNQFHHIEQSIEKYHPIQIALDFTIFNHDLQISTVLWLREHFWTKIKKSNKIGRVAIVESEDPDETMLIERSVKDIFKYDLLSSEQELNNWFD